MILQKVAIVVLNLIKNIDLAPLSPYLGNLIRKSAYNSPKVLKKIAFGLL